MSAKMDLTGDNKANSPKVYNAFAVHKAGEAVKPWTYQPIALKDDEVEVAIECCGVCHSDLHQQHNDWKVANFPLVCGHEIIGEIINVGSKVTDPSLKIGQRVGVGPQTGACGNCRECNRGEEQQCFKKIKSYNTPTGDAHQPYTFGGFAEHIRVRAAWAFPIPAELPSEQAAPLLCAGVTTWTPFMHYKVQKGAKVGIIGVGGLGHVGLQFAVKLGYDVTAISSSADKQADAKKMGCDKFINSSDAKQMAAAKNSFEFLLSTVSANGVDWGAYLDLLMPDGHLCMVGLPTQITMNPNKIVLNRLNLCGSYLASNKEVRNMLEFCAKHKILALTESLDMTADGCNKALKKVEDNSARYRMVVVNKGFKSLNPTKKRKHSQ
jgi:uncharacterized zinc-type alcohol dehydrogenase-like protein